MERDESELIIQLLSDALADLAQRFKRLQEELAKHKGIESNLRLKNLLNHLKPLNR